MDYSNKSTKSDSQFEVLQPADSGLSKAIKGLLVILVGVISTAYLLNPGAGFIEMIPDNFPVIGNLDEAGATLILLSCLAYFGIDLRPFKNLFKRKSQPR